MNENARSCRVDRDVAASMGRNLMLINFTPRIGILG